jgi:hypothetical protein
VGAQSIPRARDALKRSVTVMAKRNGDARGLKSAYLAHLKCRRAHAAAVARWREQAPQMLTGKPAALWRELDELSRRKRELGRRLRRAAKAYP